MLKPFLRPLRSCAGGLLTLVEARPLERLRTLVREREDEAPFVLGEGPLPREAERDRTERAASDGQRHGRERTADSLAHTDELREARDGLLDAFEPDRLGA